MSAPPDPGMTPPELTALRQALRTEYNPNHLFGFASAMAPDHCVSASLLHARATVLEMRRRMDPNVLHQLLEAVTARAYGAPATDPTAALRRRNELETYARRSRVDPRPLYRAVRSAAGDLVIDPSADLRDLPPPVAGLAEVLVLQLGPVRVLSSDLVHRALPPSRELTTADEYARRLRWLRQYQQEALLGS